MAAPALVLSGGNALGAYHAGVWTALEAAGIEPGWIAGSSIGAVTGAIVAGTAPGAREAGLRRFWNQAQAFGGIDALFPDVLRRPIQFAQALSSRLLGQPGLFTLRLPDPTGAEQRPGLFNAGAMRRLIEEIVDFDRLNSGLMRLSVVATDLASGEARIFDTRSGRIGIDHLMASAALLPDFPPVEVGGRLLVDGGLSANLPVEVMLDERVAQEAERLTIFAVDLFPAAAPLPRGLGEAAQRQNDLIFSSQTRAALRAGAALWQNQTPGADVLLLAYEALADETALKGYDFGRQSLDRRWAAGRRDMEAQLAVWRTLAADTPGLTVHPPMAPTPERIAE